METSRGQVFHRPADGLCGACRHARSIVNDRGSRFVLCGRSVEDARFPRYPPMPVRSCAGFEPPAPADPGDATDPA